MYWLWSSFLYQQRASPVHAMSKLNVLPFKAIDYTGSIAALQQSHFAGATLCGSLILMKWLRWTLTFGVFVLSLMVSQVFAYSTVTLTASDGTTTRAYTVAFTREVNQLSYNQCKNPINNTPWWGKPTLATNLAAALGGSLGAPVVGTYGPLFAFKEAATVVNSAWNTGGSIATSGDNNGWGLSTPGVYAVDPNFMDSSGACTTAILGTAKPVLTSLSPNSGRTAGGTTVTITGNNFTGTTGVTIGGVAVTSFTVVSDT